MKENYRKLGENMSHGLDFPNGKSGDNKRICSNLTVFALKVKGVRPEQMSLTARSARRLYKTPPTRLTNPLVMLGIVLAIPNPCDNKGIRNESEL